VSAAIAGGSLRSEGMAAVGSWARSVMDGAAAAAVAARRKPLLVGMCGL
jgi:hypothetical protein